MARETWIWDRATEKMVMVSAQRVVRERGVTIIKDIAPYRAAAADKRTGKRPVIGGRAEHRDFLRRNGYIELGNEPIRRKIYEGGQRGDIARDIKRALGE